MKKYELVVLFAIGFSHLSIADLAPLAEEEMALVQGQGVGVVFEDFVFSHGDNGADNLFKITGIKSTEGEDVQITVSQLYISGDASNYGTNLNPVNLGRLTNPYTIDLLDGNTIGIEDKAVLQFAAPTKDGSSDCGVLVATGCSSRASLERFDTGLNLGVKVGNKAAHNLNVNAKSAVVDGSYLRLWADDDMGGAGGTQLVAEYRLNFYTPELSISTCDSGGANCGSTIFMRNFELELAMGNSLQPMYLDVNGSGNFVFEVKNIRDAITGSVSSDGKSGGGYNEFLNYYTNPDFRSNLRIGELSVSGQNFGSAKIEGMLIQYLRIESHDLGN